MYSCQAQCSIPVMLTQEEILALKYRAELIIQNLSKCMDGKDIHQVRNMLQTAQGLAEVLNREKECEDLLKDILDRVESQQVEYFRKKYSHLGSKRPGSSE